MSHRFGLKIMILGWVKVKVLRGLRAQAVDLQRFHAVLRHLKLHLPGAPKDPPIPGLDPRIARGRGSPEAPVEIGHESL